MRPGYFRPTALLHTGKDIPQSGERPNVYVSQSSYKTHDPHAAPRPWILLSVLSVDSRAAPGSVHLHRCEVECNVRQQTSWNGSKLTRAFMQ